MVANVNNNSCVPAAKIVVPVVVENPIMHGSSNPKSPVDFAVTFSVPSTQNLDMS